MLLGPDKQKTLTIELQLAASLGSNTIKPDPLTNPCLLPDNLKESPITSALGKPELDPQLQRPWINIS